MLHITVITCYSILFFFLNQQFITQHAVVDCGSYFVAMYKRSKLHGKKKTEEREREKEEMKN